MWSRSSLGSAPAQLLRLLTGLPAGPPGARPLPRVLELAAFNTAHVFALDHTGVAVPEAPGRVADGPVATPGQHLASQPRDPGHGAHDVCAVPAVAAGRPSRRAGSTLTQALAVAVALAPILTPTPTPTLTLTRTPTPTPTLTLTLPDLVLLEFGINAEMEP